MSKYKVNIAHLYPDLLNLYGDKGNIESITKRLMWRGIDAKLKNCTTENHDINFDDTDSIFLGGGSDKEQEVVCGYLLEKKKELTEFVQKGGTLIALCGGYTLLGKYYLNTATLAD